MSLYRPQKMTRLPDELYFVTFGQSHPESPLFIFLPGLDETSLDLMRAQTKAVEDVFDVRCLVIPPENLNDWDTLARQVVNLTQAELSQAFRPSVYLCGESFGGCLALKVALEAPQLFNRLILVNPATSFNQFPWIHWGSLFTRFLPEFSYQALSVTILPFLVPLHRVSYATCLTLAAEISSAPKESSMWRIELMRDFKVSEEEVRSLAQPVLLIGSRADILLPSVREVQRLARIMPNAQVELLPHSGHACLLEAGIDLYQIMKGQDFLDRDVKAAEQSHVM
jgi:pimeloyl-ACP methyl ester carboxylesterase